MADKLYLSYWLPGNNPLNLLRRYEKMLSTFPYSKLALRDPSLRVYAIAYSEPPLIETPLPTPLDVDDVMKICNEFQHPDSCYELSAAWDLWHFDKDWSVGPAVVQLTCFGPEFDRDLGDNLRIDFGIEDQFLPQPESPEGTTMIESNIKSLLRLVHDLDDRLNSDRRLLWTDSGENFAERLQAALSELQG